MNFSEYTLISFGDSFTFGQDLVTQYSIDHEDLRPIQKQYKQNCNNLSYTKILADKLRFKDSLNFGVLGGSNERSITLLESFLRTNPDKKVFVLFNFTSASRFMNIFKVDDKNHYDIVDLIPNLISNVQWNKWLIGKERYTGIDAKSIIKHYTYWRNSVQDVYSHIKDRRNLYYLLSSHNTPHVTFDIVNNTDALMLRDNPLKYIRNTNEDLILNEMDYFNSYYNEILTASPLLCHMGIDDLGGQRNFQTYLNNRAKFEHEDIDYYSAIHGGHWNSKGHIEVARLIEKFLNERYK